QLGERLVREGGTWATILDPLVSTGSGDWGLVNTSAGVAPGLSVDQLNLVIYGVLIIGFLIFEPLGLYGIWLRIRNYWKGWPFTYCRAREASSRWTDGSGGLRSGGV